MQKRRRRILWIDSNIDELKTHILFLEHKGYDITPVTNGLDGLSTLDEKIYDAVLLDHNMPDMDGIRILSKIKKIQPYLPVIMVTQNDEKEVISEAIIHQADDFLMKPVSPRQIVSVLTFLLEYDALTRSHISGICPRF
jgi:CheY-like chemotaxis protein